MPRRAGGKSAEAEWFLLDINGMGLYHHGSVNNNGRTKFRDVIVVPKQQNSSGDVRLSTLIHEINECEVFHILKRFGEGATVLDLGKRAHRDRRQTLLRYLRKHFPELVKGVRLSKRDKICITHIVSPYGDGMCLIPKREFRASWGSYRRRRVKQHRGEDCE